MTSSLASASSIYANQSVRTAQTGGENLQIVVRNSTLRHYRDEQ